MSWAKNLLAVAIVSEREELEEVLKSEQFYITEAERDVEHP